MISLFIFFFKNKISHRETKRMKNEVEKIKTEKFACIDRQFESDRQFELLIQTRNTI